VLKRGDKIQYYHKEKKTVVGEPLTIRKCEVVEDGFNVWVKEPFAGEGSIPLASLVAVVGDNEYGVVRPWKYDRDNWGFVLRPL
jgi:hypothetical protein